jgi:RND superfamily putative drug exporter
MLDTLGRVISRHPWWFVMGWIVAVIVAGAAAFGGVFGQPLFERLSSGQVAVPGETQEGTDLLARTQPDGPTELLLLDNVSDLSSKLLQRQFEAARQDLRMIQHVKRINDPYAEKNGLLDADSIPYISDDQRAVLMVVTLEKGLDTETQDEVLGQVAERLEQIAPALPGTKGYVGGINQIVEEVTHQVETDLARGEGTALPISLGIMIIVFGGFLAALLPILGALAAIAGAMATLLAFSYLIVLDASTVNVVTVLGLGLCIDYGLLLVSRYREEMVALPGDPKLPPTRRQREGALRRTMTSAGRTVLFSGITVAVALTGLLLFQASFLKAIGAAGVSVVVVALLVALTLVPALLALVKVRMIRPGLVHRVPLLGRFVKKLGDVAPEEGVFSRLARFVQRFPVIVLLGVVGILFVGALPIMRMELVASGTALLPKSSPSRQLFDNFQARFPYASPPTIQVAADAPKAQTKQFLEQIRAIPAVISADVSGEQGDASTGRISVIAIRVGGSPGSPIARGVVRQIREMDPGYRTWTTGDASGMVDYLHDLKTRAPFAVGVVVLTTFILLFLMTGSLLVPLKALVMNLVSLGASLGIVVWVFQDGNLEKTLSFSSAGGLETFIPPLTLAFGFGLAMDYEVFLLSRISEFRKQGYSNDKAVVLGLQQSGRIITSAALIIVVVFAGFVAGKLLIIKETGLSLAVAVAIDATLVRMLLVPATMTLLGEWNWWAPKFMRRIHDRYGFSE